MANPPKLRVSIEYMRPADFATMLTSYNRQGGDLVTPPISPLAWPVEAGDDAEAFRRLEYSTLQHRTWFDRDPTAHCIKASHAENGEIVSIARWNFFPNGYELARDEHVDVAEFVPEESLQVNGGPYAIDLYRDMRQGAMRSRMEWMTSGKPCWVKDLLMSMVTREFYRKQGAAGQLIDWGVERARQNGVPAYLEASAAGKPVYERHGFRQIGDLTRFDCRPHGRDIVFNIAKMAWFPDGCEVK